jgi:hypothetical protein
MDKVRLVPKNYKHRLILCLLGFSQLKEPLYAIKMIEGLHLSVIRCACVFMEKVLNENYSIILKQSS